MTDEYSDFDYGRRGGFGSKETARKPFEVDKGRVIHSAAFRRLQGKTQALGTGESDFFRTRLTHSLEVAQLGRGLCRELDRSFDPDQDLVEVICLAHDIGHPPYGHSVEELLNYRMSAFGGFGANPQNIRIVSALEAKFMDVGLDLTRATLDGLIKYPVLFDKVSSDAKFTYADDKELLDWVKSGLRNRRRLPLEAQIADWADQMAYSVNDIEDSLDAGILSLSGMRDRAGEIEKHAAKAFEKKMRHLDRPTTFPARVAGRTAVIDLANNLEERYLHPTTLRQRNINLKDWTSSTIKTFKLHCRIQPVDASESSVRYRHALILSDEAIAVAAMLQSVSRLLVFSDKRVTRLEEEGCRLVSETFDFLLAHPDQLPEDLRELHGKGRFSSLQRIVCDFVSGMTDQYARKFYDDVVAGQHSSVVQRVSLRH